MLTIGEERSQSIEINVGSEVRAVTFSANGEYLLSGNDCVVRMWRVESRQKVASMYMNRGKASCLAVSDDGKWIAAGTYDGDVFAWDATTYKQVLRHSEGVSSASTHGVDFSPDSTRLVSATKEKATVWNLATRKQVRALSHEHYVIAAKYSPQGDRIATATRNGPVRVWDGNDGRLLVKVKVEVSLWWNKGLLWFNDHLLVVSGGKIKELDVSTRPTVSEWPVSNTNHHYSNIALTKHKKLISCSAHRSLTLWDTSTHTQFDVLQHPQAIRSIEFSPDDRFLAICGEGGKIIIEHLSRSTVSSISLD